MKELTREAFDALLTALGTDRVQAAERYERIRRRMIRFFEWEGSPTPEDHADEAINRVARRIAGGEEVRDVEGYFHGVCQLLLKEIAALGVRRDRALHQVHEQTRAVEQPRMVGPVRGECLDCCLNDLSPDQRALILRYYEGERTARIQNRRKFAAELGIPVNALRNRALRIRERLEHCMEDCSRREEGSAEAGSAEASGRDRSANIVTNSEGGVER